MVDSHHCKGGIPVKNTDDLQQELMEAHDLDQFLSDNEENFINNSVCELLSLLFRKRNISKATLAKQSGMSEVYLHQVLPAGAIPPAAAFCVFALACKPPWRKHRSS